MPTLTSPAPAPDPVTVDVTAAVADPRLDRLFALLPAYHRERDAEQGYPLKALLRVIAEQVNVVEDDIAQLYENLFIETCDDWVVPYIGDLVGWQPVPDAGLPPDETDRAEPRVLVPRREIAHLIRSRRLKGTVGLLDLLAGDVAGWPARTVQSFEQLAWAQHLDHPHPCRHRLADLRDMDALGRIDTPFDTSTRTVDLRRPDSHRTVGRFDIPSIAVSVWRLLSVPVTNTPACCIESAGAHCFTFSVLGQDAPLFVAPREPTASCGASSPPGELELPVAIRRVAFFEHSGDYLGTSLAIRTDGWAGVAGTGPQPVPPAQIVPADLSDWRYVPMLDHVAVDPVLGRIAFPPSQLPRKGVRVDYRYGFPANLGGGEYARPVIDPVGDFTLYRVGDDLPFKRLGDALAQWRTDQPLQAVIEFAASGVYVEPISIQLAAGQSLQLRAADRTRPVLRLIDWQTDLPDALSVTMDAGSRFTLDGLIVTGRPLQVTATEGGHTPDVCGASVVVRHCTLVPGWGIDCDCEPKRPAEPSLTLDNVRARVRIERSIVGSIEIHEDETRFDPIPLCIADSIVDATAPDREAIGAPGDTWAPATLDIRRCTVFGIVDVHAMTLGENCIFDGCVNVARRQVGCLRFSYVPTECRTPRRYACQPDGVVAAVKARLPNDAAAQAREIADETLRVTPQFVSVRYGSPAYAQLALDGPAEIARGADDESEMGVYHDLYQPQRSEVLRARLADSTPAGMDTGTFFAN
jgi:hypothetical protein